MSHAGDLLFYKSDERLIQLCPATTCNPLTIARQRQDGADDHRHEIKGGTSTDTPSVGHWQDDRRRPRSRLGVITQDERHSLTRSTTVQLPTWPVSPSVWISRSLSLSLSLIGWILQLTVDDGVKRGMPYTLVYTVYTAILPRTLIHCVSTHFQFSVLE